MSTVLTEFLRDTEDAKKWVNQTSGTVPTRLGSVLTPLPVRNQQFADAIASTGWFVVGEFANGFTYTAKNQVGTDANGNQWSYNGSLPFTVTAGTVPSSPDYTNRGDAALRSELADGSADIAGETAEFIATNARRFALNSAISVKDFGAVGDGVADDTAAFQAAIDSLPLNTADVGVLTPKGFSQGGQILIPPGRYKITNTITMTRGIRFTGQSRESSQIASFCTGSVFKFNDTGRYIQEEFVFEHLSIWQDASVTAVSGACIEVFLGPTSVQSTSLIVDNMILEGHYRGILLGAAIWSTVKNVVSSKHTLYGFDVRFTSAGVGASTSTTSTSFINCYAFLCESGFRIERGAYCSFISCASDSNTEYGYIVQEGIGHSFVACGAEDNFVAGALFDRSEGTYWNGFIVYGIRTGVKHGIVLNQAVNTTISGGAMHSVTASGGYGIKVETAGGNITIIGTKFDYNFTGFEIDSQFKVLRLDAQGGLVGGGTTTGNRWAIGATQQPESDATFAVSGTASAGVNYTFKINGTHTSAGASRNAGAFVQAVTAPTAITYPLVIGEFIANTSQGAGSTIQRAAGFYVQEQTRGTTANANIMIDSSSGTVPVGNWNIYSDSLRNNYLKGPLSWALPATATPTSNNDITFERTSNTSITIKLKGTDGVVRSVALTLA